MNTDGLSEKAKRIYKDVKDSVYKSIASVEQDIENRQGVAGSIADIVDKAKEKHGFIKENGGYIKTAKDSIDKTIENVYEKIDDKLFTDGKIDKNKAKEIAKDGAAIIEKYGRKAGVVLYGVSKTVGDKIVTSYRELVPSKNERETIYAGIGTRYGGVLLRPNYESCLKFYDHAKMLIPKNTKYRRTILRDIKASASSDVMELKEFYKFAEDVNVIAPKKQIVNKYLYGYIAN